MIGAMRTSSAALLSNHDRLGAQSELRDGVGTTDFDRLVYCANTMAGDHIENFKLIIGTLRFIDETELRLPTQGGQEVFKNFPRLSVAVFDATTYFTGASLCARV